MGNWKNYEELEESLSMPELIQTLKSFKKQKSEDRKFAAGLKGIEINIDEDEEEVQEGKSDVDYFGIVTISVSLVALLYALNVSPSWGWISYKTISLLVIFVLFMAFFLIIEKRKDDGLIPSDVMGNFQFMIAGFVMFTYIPGFFAILLYVTQYLEKFLNYTPLEAGAVLVPMLAVFSATSAMSARIYNKIGAFSNKRFVFYNPDLVNNAYRLLHSDMLGELKNPAWQQILVKRNTMNGDVDSPNKFNQRVWGGNSNDYFRQY